MSGFPRLASAVFYGASSVAIMLTNKEVLTGYQYAALFAFLEGLPPPLLIPDGADPAAFRRRTCWRWRRTS